MVDTKRARRVQCKYRQRLPHEAVVAAWNAWVQANTAAVAEKPRAQQQQQPKSAPKPKPEAKEAPKYVSPSALPVPDGMDPTQALATQIRHAMKEEVQVARQLATAAANTHERYARKLRELSGGSDSKAPSSSASAASASAAREEAKATASAAPSPALRKWLDSSLPCVEWASLSRFCTAISVSALKQRGQLSPAVAQRCQERNGRALLACQLVAQALLKFPSWRTGDLAQARVFVVTGWCIGPFVNSWERHTWLVLGASATAGPRVFVDISSAQFGIKPEADWTICEPLLVDDALPLRPDNGAAAWFVQTEVLEEAQAEAAPPAWHSGASEEEQSLQTAWSHLDAALAKVFA